MQVFRYYYRSEMGIYRDSLSAIVFTDYRYRSKLFGFIDYRYRFCNLLCYRR